MKKNIFHLTRRATRNDAGPVGRVSVRCFLFFVLCFGLFAATTSLAGASEFRSERFGSTSYYTVPSSMTRMLASPSTGEDDLYGSNAYRSDVSFGSCNPCDEPYDRCGPAPCGKKSWWKRLECYGWVQGGFQVNARGNTTDHVRIPDRRDKMEKFHVPTSGNSSLLGNVQSTEGMMNQLWFGVKRELDTRCGFDWGFQADLTYGTDGWLAQSFGDASFDYRLHNRDYYLAIPQLYASFGYRDLSVKVGKFETLLGFEHLQAPESFFYSHSNLFYTEPQTHSGVLFEHQVRPGLRLCFGYVQGADNSFHNRFDDQGFLGGIYWRPFCSVTVWYTIYASDLGEGRYANGERHPGGTIFQHTFVTNWKITSRWDYSFQWNLGDRNASGGYRGASYFGTAHYLTCKLNSKWNVGLRFDQVHGNGPMNLSGFGRPGTGNYHGDLYGLTLGFNWTPCSKLNVRPELRFDHADDCKPFDGGKHRDQFSAGCGILYMF